jgi:hypothetical protein
MPNLSDTQMQNLLAAITDERLAGSDISKLLNRHPVDAEELAALIQLIDQLDTVMIPVQPSRSFVRRLRQDLIGVENPNVLVRVRRLPPRVQIAAGIALVAGFMFLSRRRWVQVPSQEHQEHLAAH